jgi:hypothetical protein
MNRIIAAAFGVAAVATAALTANASHSWNNYHWARTTSSFTLQTLDSTANSPYARWPSELGLAASDWSQSTVLDLHVVPYANDSSSRRKCAAVLGKIRVCNQSYGKNGWLGLASINISGAHITQGTAKMNDSYTTYWTSHNGEARHVMCQEVGHTFGLGHQDESGASLNTCMDYYATADGTTSTKPNAHDYDQLKTIYSHLDSTTTVGTAVAVSPAQQSMAGQVPMGVRVVKGKNFEIWAAPDGRGGTWIHHVYLAPAAR